MLRHRAQVCWHGILYRIFLSTPEPKQPSGASFGYLKIERHGGNTDRTLDERLSPTRRLHIFESDVQKLAWIAGVAIIYFAAGKLGLYFASFTASSSSVWPPTGIAFAALLILGYQIWPGVFLGAFFVNLATSGAVFTSLGIATGNTLEAVAAVYLTMRYANGRKLFEHAQDFFKFAALSMLAAAISATFGVTSLALGGLAHSHEFVRVWLTWWLGDVGGFLMFAPFPILWIENPRLTGDRRRLLEVLIDARCDSSVRDSGLWRRCFPESRIIRSALSASRYWCGPRSGSASARPPPRFSFSPFPPSGG